MLWSSWYVSFASFFNGIIQINVLVLGLAGGKGKEVRVFP